MRPTFICVLLILSITSIALQAQDISKSTIIWNSIKAINQGNKVARINDFFVVSRRTEVQPVRQAQNAAVGFEAFAQSLAQPACSTGQQKPFMDFDRHLYLAL